MFTHSFPHIVIMATRDCQALKIQIKKYHKIGSYKLWVIFQIQRSKSISKTNLNMHIFKSHKFKLPWRDIVPNNYDKYDFRYWAQIICCYDAFMSSMEPDRPWIPFIFNYRPMKQSSVNILLNFLQKKKSYRFRSMSNWWQIFHFWLNYWWQIRNCIWSNYMTTVLSLLLISESRASEDMDVSSAPAPIQDRECSS